ATAPEPWRSGGSRWRSTRTSPTSKPSCRDTPGGRPPDPYFSLAHTIDRLLLDVVTSPALAPRTNRVGFPPLSFWRCSLNRRASVVIAAAIVFSVGGSLTAFAAAGKKPKAKPTPQLIELPDRTDAEEAPVGSRVKA